MIQCLLPCTSVTTDAKVSMPHALLVPEFAKDEEQSKSLMVTKRMAKRRQPSSKKILSSLLFLWIASCSNEDDHFQKHMQEILLWSATAEMILNDRLGGLVPKGFTDLAVERCRKEISDLSSQLPPSARYAEARANIFKLDRLIAAADDEIAQGRFEKGHQHLIELHQHEVELRRASGADG